jgi:hypothetical protein
MKMKDMQVKTFKHISEKCDMSGGQDEQVEGLACRRSDLASHRMEAV